MSRNLFSTIRRALHTTNRLSSQPQPAVSQLRVREYIEEAQQELAANKSIEAEALRHPDFFNVHDLFTVQDLFYARVHFGHKVGSLNDKMSAYLYGSRMGHCIFDLDKTAVHLRHALNFAAHVAFRDGVILFLHRGAQNAHLVEKTAIECEEFSHTRYWRGGIFTNANVQYKSVTRLPDLCIFLNTLNNVMMQHIGVRDAAKMNIPTIGVVDSNCDPNMIAYPVPGNDDTPAAMELYCRVFKEAILRGKAKRRELLLPRDATKADAPVAVGEATQ